MRSSLAEYTAYPVPTAITTIANIPVLVLKNDRSLGCFGAVVAASGAAVFVETTFAIDLVENEGEAGGPCDAAIAGENAVASRAVIRPTPAKRRTYS